MLNLKQWRKNLGKRVNVLNGLFLFNDLQDAYQTQDNYYNMAKATVGFIGSLSVGKLSAMGAAFIFSEATVPVCIIGVGILYFVGSMEGQALGEYFVDYIHNKYYVEK